MKEHFEVNPYIFLKNSKKFSVYVVSDNEKLYEMEKTLKFFTSLKIATLPAWDSFPYDKTSPSNHIISERIKTLYSIFYNKIDILLVPAVSLMQKIPPLSLIKTFRLEKGMTLNQEEFITSLVKYGYMRNSIAIDSSEFAVRGGIIDIVGQGGVDGIRIYFDFDKIENIKTYDKITQITKDIIEDYILLPSSEIILNEETISQFKDRFLTNYGLKATNHPLYEHIIQGKKFIGFENLMPYFYEKLDSLFKYLEDANFYIEPKSWEVTYQYWEKIQEYYKDNNEFTFLPQEFWLSPEEIKEHIGVNVIKATVNLVPNYYELASYSPNIAFKKMYDYSLGLNKIKVIALNSKASQIRASSLLEGLKEKYKLIENIADAEKGLFNLTILPVSEGFEDDKIFFVTESLIFGKKFFTVNNSQKKKIDNLLNELSNLKPNDYIVHKDFGIGQFLNIETLEVFGALHDCLKILYDQGDKLYLPVENIDLIKKFGEGEENVSLDRLGNLSWQNRKAGVKKRINEIAEALIALTAKRSLLTSKPIYLDHSIYQSFCNKFPYAETEDQLNAIDNIIEDLNSEKLMDRLICGDVGFGKTEVAMRGAFIVAANKMQVAVIVPTTLLANQHYVNFTKRFKGFDIRIAKLSRIVSPKEAKIIKEDLKEGKIDIIIGTHSLFAENINFNNLKLVIIDEEQHFGVKQKEKLKTLKDSVHVMSLSATPIPRTLQMSMLGIKDLSLIATPPLERLPVKTIVSPFDRSIIREALIRENLRGGRSFYVVPRILDLEKIYEDLKNIVPELKISIAHGRMSATSNDEVMNEFYEGKTDILLSTTIIESGIDVSSANTMIIHNADMLGLGQLYQLRGRIGRGKIRGYAYLVYSKKTPSHTAGRKLEIMQNIDNLGAGFNIASHDLDIRGAGNLIGAEQSGNIKEIGFELYQEMLTTAINKMKDLKPEEEDFTPQINIGLSVLIPESYISDANLRLALYRRIAELKSEEIESFIDEMSNRFGRLPKEFDNLILIIKIKQECKNLQIKKLDAGPKGIVCQFTDKADFDKIMNFIGNYKKSCKLKPDNKLVIEEKENYDQLKAINQILAGLL